MQCLCTYGKYTANRIILIIRCLVKNRVCTHDKIAAEPKARLGKERYYVNVSAISASQGTNTSNCFILDVEERGYQKSGWKRLRQIDFTTDLFRKTPNAELNEIINPGWRNFKSGLCPIRNA